MTPLLLSHSFSPSARWYLIQAQIRTTESRVIITDRADDLLLWTALSTPEHPVIRVDRVEILLDWQLFVSTHPVGTTFLIHPHLLETQGTIEYLQRQTTQAIRRGVEMSMDTLIETILAGGYTYVDHTDGRATYRRGGSIIEITDPYRDISYQIEYFDTEIDSIIRLDRGTGDRRFLDEISLPLVTYRQEITRLDGVLNIPLLDQIGSSEIPQKQESRIIPIILIGDDFCPYISTLQSHAQCHYTDFYHGESVSLLIDPIQIEHIDELSAFLREKVSTHTIIIHTKYPDPIRDFLSYHQIEGVEIRPNPLGRFESFMMNERQKQGVEKESQPSNISPAGIHDLSENTPAIDEIRSFSEISENTPLIILADDILSPLFTRRRTRSVTKHLDLLLQIQSGDFVVHRDHGIGRFSTRITKDLGGIRREYLEIHYAEGDKLFVPMIEVYRISKYIGDGEPTLTRLDGKEWTRTIEKTDEELEQIATELIEIGAKRSLARGIAFGVFGEEEKVFLDSFGYRHTPDQMMSIREIFADMESEIPMDRLLSGDVGFGKTEVAMNAVYKAVLSGYQVAVVSPLLVLADEHYETFLDRMAGYGVRIACLTRMTPPHEERKILSDLKSGRIDVIIGTHRLLSEDIRFARLGLLVIDEEHRFGVSHKERFKKMRSNVDILSLSATPIPRSLNLALSGLRKISLLTTPPAKKLPIETVITRWNETIIANAVRREMDRGGQVLIIHNRIHSLTQIESEIRDLLQISDEPDPDTSPSSTESSSTSSTVAKQKKTQKRTQISDEARQDFSSSTPRIITTHGRMSGDEIEDRIHAFKKGDYAILISTTIIENGVNFLSANTIIILDPETFGLASLHQLRGRVGRRDQQGYCYLVYRKPDLADTEKTRLITIVNNSRLGAGFEIAMRDMEIRGAGEVLGLRQAGKSKEVGLSLYFRMLEEKIESIRNHRKKRSQIKIELDLSYGIEDELFANEMDKLSFFREIESIETIEELDDRLDSLDHGVETEKGREDRENFALLLRSRLILSDYQVTSLKKIGEYYVFDFDPSVSTQTIRDFLTRCDPRKQMALLSLTKIRVTTKSYRGGSLELLKSLE